MVKFLRVKAIEIARFIVQMNKYTGITLTGTINDSPTKYVGTYDTGKLILRDSNFFLTSCELYVKPQFFGLTSFVDGVYKLKVTMNRTDGYTTITNCAFIDVTMKCRVAAALQNLSRDSNKTNTGQVSSMLHVLHYGLTNGSNCGCNCEELVVVYTELNKLLTNVDPKTLNDCGC